MKAKQMEGQWVAEMTKRRELHNQLQDMVGSLRVTGPFLGVSGGQGQPQFTFFLCFVFEPDV